MPVDGRSDSFADGFDLGILIAQSTATAFGRRIFVVTALRIDEE